MEYERVAIFVRRVRQRWILAQQLGDARDGIAPDRVEDRREPRQIRDDVLVLAVPRPSDWRGVKRVITPCWIGAERDQQFHHAEIAAAGSVVERAAIETG